MVRGRGGGAQQVRDDQQPRDAFLPRRPRQGPGAAGRHHQAPPGAPPDQAQVGRRGGEDEGDLRRAGGDGAATGEIFSKHPNI